MWRRGQGGGRSLNDEVARGQHLLGGGAGRSASTCGGAVTRLSKDIKTMILNGRGLTSGENCQTHGYFTLVAI